MRISLSKHGISGLARRAARITLAAILVSLCGAHLARADSLADRVGRLSDAAFVMLNSLNEAAAGKASGGPLLASTADLASSAQTLDTALKSGDSAGARNAMAAIVRDRAAIKANMTGGSPVIANWDLTTVSAS